MRKTSHSCLVSTFINTQETLNGYRNLTQQDIQTPSHFKNEDVVEKIPTTTQQSISPIHPSITTPHNKNYPFLQTALQLTIKPSVVPKYSHMNYQKNRPITKTRQSNKQNYE